MEFTALLLLKTPYSLHKAAHTLQAKQQAETAAAAATAEAQQQTTQVFGLLLFLSSGSRGSRT